MGGIKKKFGKRLGERRGSKGDRWGGAADARIRPRAPGRRGRGAKQVAKPRGRTARRVQGPQREGDIYRK